MDIPAMINQMKQHPEFARAGMVLYHNGVVRGTSREGDKVTGLSIKVDHQRLGEIVAEAKTLPGIIEVLVHINEDKPLMVGDDVMFLAVAGDIRENVIHALGHTLNRIKAEATSKTQVFA
jgi:molybdopterin synthase catalytic subunit